MAARGVTGPVVALTGTPGTGKTSVAKALRRSGAAVLDLARYVDDPRFDEGADAAHHDAHVLDEEAIDRHLAEHLVQELALPTPYAEPVFVESHFAHDLDCVDRVLVLRCRPSVLAARLRPRGWPEAKLRANLEAEGLDLIVQEAVERRDAHAAEGHMFPVGEVDTTERDAEEVAGIVRRLATAPPAELQIGTVDWAGEVLGWY